jgi:hypothetical protein
MSPVRVSDLHYDRAEGDPMDTLKNPPDAGTRHPMLWTVGIMLGVVSLCLFLAWVSMQ